MAAQRKYPDELRERTVRMLFEVRERGGKGHGELARVARQLGVHGVGTDRLPAPALCPRAQPGRAVWSHLKRSLANLAKHNISQLIALVKTRLKRMQYRPGLLDGFLASTGSTSHPSATPTIKDL